MLFLPQVQGDVDENYARTIRSLHWEADFTRSGVVVPRLLASPQTSFGVRSSRDVYMIRTGKKIGSFYLSEKLPTYLSPKATLILTSHLR